MRLFDPTISSQDHTKTYHQNRTITDDNAPNFDKAHLLSMEDGAVSQD